MVHIQKKKKALRRINCLCNFQTGNTILITIVMSPLVCVPSSGLTYFMIERVYLLTHFIPPHPQLDCGVFCLFGEIKSVLCRWWTCPLGRGLKWAENFWHFKICGFRDWWDPEFPVTRVDARFLALAPNSKYPWRVNLQAPVSLGLAKSSKGIGESFLGRGDRDEEEVSGAVDIIFTRSKIEWNHLHGIGQRLSCPAHFQDLAVVYS